MKKAAVILLLFSFSSAVADQDLQKDKNDREISSDFTKDYLEKIASVPHQIKTSESEDSTYHDKVIQRFSRFK
ncbi:MAG: hypothetical protein IPM57_01650 [Oligoflexia bacterium]|nr:hypothetical protein [Oligoflexia bacterium]